VSSSEMAPGTFSDPVQTTAPVATVLLNVGLQVEIDFGHGDDVLEVEEPAPDHLDRDQRHDHKQ